MPKQRNPQTQEVDSPLKGWKQIAEFLGEPVSVVKRWKSQGMPVFDQGRFVSSTKEKLNKWLGGESGKPVHEMTPETDLASELKRAITLVRENKRKHVR